ncbi:MAG: hypothetical protein V3T92_02615 [Anaerolineae bacterium]
MVRQAHPQRSRRASPCSSRRSLRQEGIPEDKIHFVGNVMIDTLVRLLPKAENRPILAELGLIEQRSPGAGEQRSKGAEEPFTSAPPHGMCW